ncbi:MAG: hypothetical protein VR72_07460 [Clostridiaceae bacterium BRH_c20a]|nr:MAG: hypothetical protein VR72_07460 [Clostridiaceae bacterium BRH_c20a]
MEVISDSDIKKMLDNSGLKIKELYKNKHILIHSFYDWDGGFDETDINEVIKFYMNLDEMLSVVEKYLKKLGINDCILGKFYNNYWLKDWSDADKFDIYRQLIFLLKKYRLSKNSNKGLKVNLDLGENVYLLKKIIEANFRFLSEIGMFFPEIGVYISSTHHFEVHIYTTSNDVNKHIELLNEIIAEYQNINVLKWCK